MMQIHVASVLFIFFISILFVSPFLLRLFEQPWSPHCTDYVIPALFMNFKSYHEICFIPCISMFHINWLKRKYLVTANTKIPVRSRALMAVTTKIYIFWDVKSCSLEKLTLCRNALIDLLSKTLAEWSFDLPADFYHTIQHHIP